MINMGAQPIELPSFTPIAAIQRVVAGSFGIALKNMLSEQREFAWERHVAMYLSRELTGKSLPVIGRAFFRDHTTILAACRRVEKRLDSDPLARADVEALKAALCPVEALAA